ncbi:MAG: hypothetical protein MZV63_25330 [Marinilabiliales bacterium]|nr:hypothetical protein [Marinilabiliales bacterium]
MTADTATSIVSITGFAGKPEKRTAVTRRTVLLHQQQVHQAPLSPPRRDGGLPGDTAT